MESGSGLDVKAKKFFGDVAVYVGHQQSEANSIFAEQNDRYAEIGIEIPSTQRHTPMHSIGQISGTKAFNYLVKVRFYEKMVQIT